MTDNKLKAARDKLWAAEVELAETSLAEVARIARAGFPGARYVGIGRGEDDALRCVGIFADLDNPEPMWWDGDADSETEWDNNMFDAIANLDDSTAAVWAPFVVEDKGECLFDIDLILNAFPHR